MQEPRLTADRGGAIVLDCKENAAEKWIYLMRWSTMGMRIDFDF